MWFRSCVFRLQGWCYNYNSMKLELWISSETIQDANVVYYTCICSDINVLQH